MSAERHLILSICCPLREVSTNLSNLCVSVAQGPLRLLPALHVAVQRGDLKMVRLLLSATTDHGRERVKQRLLEVSPVSDLAVLMQMRQPSLVLWSMPACLHTVQHSADMRA